MQVIDFKILQLIQLYMKCTLFDRLMPVFSFIGDNGIIWIILSAALLIFHKHRNTGVKMAIALVLCLLICNLTLKPLIARIRPFDINTGVVLLIEKPTDFSFPSGHTTSSFAAAAVLRLSVKNRWIGRGALALAALISFSRLYLYVHYPSDILAGVAIGVLIAAITVAIYDKKVKTSRLL